MLPLFGNYMKTANKKQGLYLDFLWFVSSNCNNKKVQKCR